MKAIIQEIQNDLLGFLRTPKLRAMIVVCEIEDPALLLKSIDAFEQDPDNPDLFLVYGFPFKNTDDYVNQVINSIEVQIEQVNQELAKRGDPRLAPRAEEDSGSPSILRLKRELEYIRAVTPPERQVNWVLFPTAIDDPNCYLGLVDSIRKELETLKGVKLIVRDSAKTPILTHQLGELPSVRIYRPELDHASLEKKMTEKANDPRISPEEQAQLHMMLAGIDAANQRFDRALARNQELLGYFTFTGQKHNQSVLLNNIGDIHYLQKNPKEAQTWYEKAISLSVELKSQPLVLYQSMNLGHALAVQQKYDEALMYYASAEQLAEASNAPIQQVEALERAGTIKYQTSQIKEAAEAWEKAVAISKRLEYEAGLRTNLEHLRRLYTETGDESRRRECEKTLSEL
jgi:tetratricopeptide (TPR) repeat protein